MGMNMNENITGKFKRLSDDKTTNVDKNVAKWFSFEEMCNIVNAHLAHDVPVYVVKDFNGTMTVHLNRRKAIIRYVCMLIDKAYMYNHKEAISEWYWSEESYECMEGYSRETLHGDTILDTDNTILYDYLSHCSDVVNGSNMRCCIVGVNDNGTLYDGHKLLSSSNDCKDNNIDLHSWLNELEETGISSVILWG